jgi:hypothetical protein
LEETIIHLAGRAALDHLNRRKQRCDDWEQCTDGRESLKRAMFLSGDDEQAAELLLQWAARRAECLVAKLWPQIHAVAFGLLEHERLNGDQVREIVERTRAKKQSLPAAA